jgi:hypothetical protein
MTAIVERPGVSRVDRKCELIWWREQAARTDKDVKMSSRQGRAIRNQ